MASNATKHQHRATTTAQERINHASRMYNQGGVGKEKEGENPRVRIAPTSHTPPPPKPHRPPNTRSYVACRTPHRTPGFPRISDLFTRC